MSPTAKPNDRRIATRLAACLICLVTLSGHAMAAETGTESERLEKLERAVELLQTRNAEPEREARSLKQQKSAAATPAPLSAEKRSCFP